MNPAFHQVERMLDLSKHVKHEHFARLNVIIVIFDFIMELQRYVGTSLGFSYFGTLIYAHDISITTFREHEITPAVNTEKPQFDFLDHELIRFIRSYLKLLQHPRFSKYWGKYMLWIHYFLNTQKLYGIFHSDEESYGSGFWFLRENGLKQMMVQFGEYEWIRILLFFTRNSWDQNKKHDLVKVLGYVSKWYVNNVQCGKIGKSVDEFELDLIEIFVSLTLYFRRNVAKKVSVLGEDFLQIYRLLDELVVYAPSAFHRYLQAVLKKRFEVTELRMMLLLDLQGFQHSVNSELPIRILTYYFKLFKAIENVLGSDSLSLLKPMDFFRGPILNAANYYSTIKKSSLHVQPDFCYDIVFLDVVKHLLRSSYGGSSLHSDFFNILFDNVLFKTEIPKFLDSRVLDGVRVDSMNRLSKMSVQQVFTQVIEKFASSLEVLEMVTAAVSRSDMLQTILSFFEGLAKGNLIGSINKLLCFNAKCFGFFDYNPMGIVSRGGEHIALLESSRATSALKKFVHHLTKIQKRGGKIVPEEIVGWLPKWRNCVAMFDYFHSLGGEYVVNEVSEDTVFETVLCFRHQNVVKSKIALQKSSHMVQRPRGRRKDVTKILDILEKEIEPKTNKELIEKAYQLAKIATSSLFHPPKKKDVLEKFPDPDLFNLLRGFALFRFSAEICVACVKDIYRLVSHEEVESWRLKFDELVKSLFHHFISPENQKYMVYDELTCNFLHVSSFWLQYGQNMQSDQEKMCGGVISKLSSIVDGLLKKLNNPYGKIYSEMKCPSVFVESDQDGLASLVESSKGMLISIGDICLCLCKQLSHCQVDIVSSPGIGRLFGNYIGLHSKITTDFPKLKEYEHQIVKVISKIVDVMGSGNKVGSKLYFELGLVLSLLLPTLLSKEKEEVFSYGRIQRNVVYTTSEKREVVELILKFLEVSTKDQLELLFLRPDKGKKEEVVGEKDSSDEVWDVSWKQPPLYLDTGGLGNDGWGVRGGAWNDFDDQVQEDQKTEEQEELKFNISSFEQEEKVSQEHGQGWDILEEENSEKDEAKKIDSNFRSETFECDDTIEVGEMDGFVDVQKYKFSVLKMIFESLEEFVKNSLLARKKLLNVAKAVENKIGKKKMLPFFNFEENLWEEEFVPEFSLTGETFEKMTKEKLEWDEKWKDMERSDMFSMPENTKKSERVMKIYEKRLKQVSKKYDVWNWGDEESKKEERHERERKERDSKKVGDNKEEDEQSNNISRIVREFRNDGEERNNETKWEYIETESSNEVPEEFSFMTDDGGGGFEFGGGEGDLEFDFKVEDNSEDKESKDSNLDGYFGF